MYAVLNLYPYNGGHLMVVPYRHVADSTDLTGPETTELAELTKQSMTALRTASGAHGFNIGMNQGTVAGAGIAAHLHQHIVPRWGAALEIMDGAKDEGLRTVCICQKGRELPYVRFKRLADNIILVDKFSDMVFKENQDKLRELNSIIVTHRAFTAYIGYDSIEKYL